MAYSFLVMMMMMTGVTTCDIVVGEHAWHHLGVVEQPRWLRWHDDDNEDYDDDSGRTGNYFGQPLYCDHIEEKQSKVTKFSLLFASIKQTAMHYFTTVGLHFFAIALFFYHFTSALFQIL